VDLITVRGKELLSRADVIIYAGSLVNPELLNYAKPECTIHNSASMTLEEIVDVFIAAEEKHLLTIRLHTGDPSLYGAIREQMDRLDVLHIEYQVVPGVSSLFGAAAALKAEFTIPGASQTLIITRTSGKTKVVEDEALESLASHGASMAVFLSAALLEKLQKELLNGGYAACTPAAIVYKATWPDEKIIRGTVGELLAMGDTLKAETGETKTALVFVGGFLKDNLLSDRSRSKLYDPEFSHEYRKGS
jgi:precorrin-4/cobalt-precorrin-4 C11-methyltransferase